MYVLIVAPMLTAVIEVCTAFTTDQSSVQCHTTTALRGLGIRVYQYSHVHDFSYCSLGIHCIDITITIDLQFSIEQ